MSDAARRRSGSCTVVHPQCGSCIPLLALRPFRCCGRKEPGSYATLRHSMMPRCAPAPSYCSLPLSTWPGFAEYLVLAFRRGTWPDQPSSSHNPLSTVISSPCLSLYRCSATLLHTVTPFLQHPCYSRLLLFNATTTATTSTALPKTRWPAIEPTSGRFCLHNWFSTLFYICFPYSFLFFSNVRIRFGSGVSFSIMRNDIYCLSK